jgi:hypothetical protein
MSIEAMKQALEALENHMEQTRPINMTQNAIHALRQAIDQTELAKHEQEPVTWAKTNESKIFITHDIKCAVNASTAGKGDCDCGAVEQAEKQESVKCTCGYSIGHPLVSKCTCTPPKQEPVGWFDWDAKREIWVQVYPHTHGKPLYDEPPRKEWVGLHLDDMPETYAGDKSFLNIARWAEAKLKEKNGAL